MFKKAVGIALMIFSTFAFADKVDQLKAFPDIQYCMEVSRFFSSGINGHEDGYARKVSRIKPEHIELLEHRVPLPHDSMWVFNAQDYTDKELGFIAEIALSGWDEAETFKTKGVSLTADAKDKLVQTYFEGCIYKRTQERVNPGKEVEQLIEMHKVSQNEQFQKLTEEQCSYIRFDVEVIQGAKDTGVDQAALEGFAKKHEGEFSEWRLERILRQITEFYAWEGSPEEYLAKELKGCE